MSDEQHEARKRILDRAVDEYFQRARADGALPEGGAVVGWTIGIAVNRIDDDGNDFDNLIIESSPGLNNFMARGLADSTAEMFVEQAMYPYDEGDEL